jgi:hypothetical protein
LQRSASAAFVVVLLEQFTSLHIYAKKKQAN